MNLFGARRAAVGALAAITLIAGQAFVAVPPVAAAASDCDLVTGNLLVNCGFESRLAGWNLSGQTDYVATDPAFARTGSYGLHASPPASYVTLAQTFATTAGHGYEVRFHLWHGGSPDPSFQARILNGTESTMVDLANVYWSDYHAYTFAFTAAGTSATLTFYFLRSGWDMDDVAVYEPLAPAVTTHPASATVAAGEDHSFTATASGAYTPTVQWERWCPAGAWSTVPGATERTLVVTAASALNGCQYRAFFLNQLGGVRSDAATLTVVPPAVTGLSGVFAKGSITVSFTPPGEPPATHFLCQTVERKGWVDCSPGDVLKGSAKTVSVRASWDGVAFGPAATVSVGR